MNITLPGSSHSRLRLYGVSPNSTTNDAYARASSSVGYQPASRFAQSIEEIYRKTNKNLASGIPRPAGAHQIQIGAVAHGPVDLYPSSNVTSSKRYEGDTSAAYIGVGNSTYA